MENEKLFQLAAWLRPQLKKMEFERQLTAFMEMLLPLFFTPFTLIGIIWLIGITDSHVLTDHISAFFIIAIFMLAMRQFPFTMYLERGEGRFIPVTLTLSSPIHWAAILIFGREAIWIAIPVAILYTLQENWRGRHAHNITWWSALSTFSQEADILPLVIGSSVFLMTGGQFPLNETVPSHWLPVLSGIVAAALVAAMMYYLALSALARLLNDPELIMTIMSMIMIAALVDPFAILMSLSYQLSAEVFYLFALGLFVVNYLLHFLSRTNERSRQHAREMQQLEALGEAFLRMTPDETAIEDILRTHLVGMFPFDRIIIELTDKFCIALPTDREVDEKTRLYMDMQSKEPYRIIPNVLREDSTVFGNALLLRIQDADSNNASSPGYIYLLRHKDIGKVRESLPGIQALASQIASSLHRIRTHQEILASQKARQELEFAGQIQTSFLPENIPAITGLDVAANLIPARQTSGDFYDFVELNNGNLGIIVADVADKGTGAALYMALSRTLIRTYALAYPDDPAKVLELSNQRILMDTRSNQFVTVFYGILNPENGELRYASAGHNPAFLLREGQTNGHYESLGKTGIPLGMFEGLTWKSQQCQLNPGDVLLAYTDGVSEAQDADGAEFGEPRLLDTTRGHFENPAKSIEEKILSAIQVFVGNAPQFDDITLVVVKKQ